MTFITAMDKKLNKIDGLLYLTAVILGVGIVLGNYYQMSAERPKTMLDNYLEKIITRMDTVSGQLSAWGTVDIHQASDRY